ncbi:hypothetical protein HC928_22300 [bacterium]|nr:hypothetical protein [bacterium]
MQGDREFYQQLEASIAKQFYDRCHAEIQELLSCCQWHITTENHVLTLIILCPTTHINWQVCQQASALTGK